MTVGVQARWNVSTSKSTVTSLGVTVSDVAPTVTFSPPSTTQNLTTVNEGQTVHYNFSVSDPGGENVTLGGPGSVPTTSPYETFSILSVGQGTLWQVSNQTLNPTTGVGSFNVLFLDGPSTSTLTVQVKEGNLSNGSASGYLPSNVANLNVNVLNVAPTPTVTGSALGTEEVPITLTGTATEPGGIWDAPYSFQWVVTDNTGQVVAPYTDPNKAAGASSQFTFDPNAPGTYTVQLEVKNSEGNYLTPSTPAVNGNPATITVASAPFQVVGPTTTPVVQPTTTPTGFNVQFNRNQLDDGEPQ